MSLSSRLPQFTSTQFINSEPSYFAKSTTIICRCGHGQHVASNITPDICFHCISIRTSARIYDELHPEMIVTHPTRIITTTFTIDTFSNVNIVSCVGAKRNPLCERSHHVIGPDDIKCEVLGCQVYLFGRYDWYQKSLGICECCEYELSFRKQLEYFFGAININFWVEIKLNIIVINCSDPICADYPDSEAMPGIVQYVRVAYLPAFQSGIDEYHALMTSLNRGYDKDLPSTLDCRHTYIKDDYIMLQFYLQEIKNCKHSNFPNNLTCDCDNIRIIPDTMSIVPTNPKLSTLRFSQYLSRASIQRIFQRGAFKS